MNYILANKKETIHIKVASTVGTFSLTKMSQLNSRQQIVWDFLFHSSGLGLRSSLKDVLILVITDIPKNHHYLSSYIDFLAPIQCQPILGRNA